MKKKSANGHAMSGVFIFALLGAFAMLSTLLVLLGAQAYQGVVNGASRNANARVLLSYPANKVRMNDCADQISVVQRNNVPMLVITHDYDGDLYETNIYCYEGKLYEMFKSVEDELSLDSGEPLADALYFLPQIKGGMFTFEVGTLQGERYSAQIALRSQPSKKGVGA